MSPVGNLRYFWASESYSQCLPMLSALYCIDWPSPLSLENATGLLEKNQPFRARVFYINRRAKFPKTKLDRWSYVEIVYFYELLKHALSPPSAWLCEVWCIYTVCKSPKVGVTRANENRKLRGDFEGDQIIVFTVTSWSLWRRGFCTSLEILPPEFTLYRERALFSSRMH